MSRWKIDDILDEKRKAVAKATANWHADEVREKLAQVLTALHPIRATLGGLIDNPGGPHSGMSVGSDFFLETFGQEHDLPAPYGVRLNGETRQWEPIAFKWDQPRPEGITHQTVEFEGGVEPHDETTVMDVWQYAIACSIHVGSFDVSDVRYLNKVSRLP